MPQALIYCRVSTQEQAREGYSLEAQERQIRAFCAVSGWTVGERYIDSGQSASSLHRPALRRMLGEIPRFSDPCIVVWRLDRLTRSVADLYRVLSLLEEAHCAFRSITEPFETQSAVGKLFITLIAAIAQWERENLAERVALGQDQKVDHTDTWTGGPPPYGYDLTSRHLVARPEEAAVVAWIYQAFWKTPNVYALVRRLNRDSIPPPGHGRHGWTPRGVTYILRNPVYAGLRTWQRHARGETGRKAYRLRPEAEWRVTEEHDYPALVAYERWRQVQSLFARPGEVRSRRTTGEHPLTGLLRCGACNSPMSGRTVRRPDGRVYRYYRCPMRYQRRTCCMPQVGGDALEEAVRSAVFDRWSGPIMLAAAVREALLLRSDTEGVRPLQSRLESVDRRRRRWESAYERESIDAGTLSRRLASLADEERGLRSELDRRAGHQKVRDSGRLAPDPERAWKQLPAAGRSVFFRELLTQVIVCQDGGIGLIWRA